jgi:uncharacterized protein (UPF0333 family)
MNRVTRMIVKLLFSMAVAVGASTIFLLAVSAHAMPGIDAANAARSASSAAVRSAIQAARDDATRRTSVHPQAHQKYRR